MKAVKWVKVTTLMLIVFLAFASCKSTQPERVSNKCKGLLEQNLQLKTELENFRNGRLSQNPRDEATAHLTQMVKSGLPGFNSDEITVEERNGRVYVSMSDKLLFRSGSARVEEKGRAAVLTLAEVMQAYPRIEILVEGHTDAVPVKGGQYNDNWELSAARAISITKILVEGKIEPARITASGKAEFKPVAPNNTPEGRARNRRTEIILIST